MFVSSQAGQVMYHVMSYYMIITGCHIWIFCSKFALRSLAKALQMEVKPYNILVSVSFPPDTDTPQLQGEISHVILCSKL